jgi:two-component system chemotaxis response regulator CheB
MPTSAAEHTEVDHILGAASMGKLLARLTTEPAREPAGPAPADMTTEVEMEDMSLEAFESEHPGRPSGFSCPDCNGVLWEIQDAGLQRFRCRVGHAWSPEGLLTQQSDALEAALWVALRSLEERAALAGRLAETARRRGHPITATQFEEQAAEAQQAARPVRDLLVDRAKYAAAWPRLGQHHGSASPPSTEATND